jgi:AcrR family transcriptional regulator
MARWEPNAHGRLAEAALELFAEHGYEQTTVAEIAERAGLTKRTFFRYFADKREVLFGAGTEFQDLIVDAATKAAPEAAPLEVVAAGLRAGGELLEGRRDFARRRAAVIAATPELQERELIKMASVGKALTQVLRERGVHEPEASLTAEAGVAAFRIAFERWAQGEDPRELPELIRGSLATLRALSSAA